MPGEPIVTIHQPEFIPWLGFFNKLWHCDIFIILDKVQFKKNNFENRNKVRTKNTPGWTWITIPVLIKGKFGQKIDEVLINDEMAPRWRIAILNTIKLSYGRSRYFDDIYPIIEKNIMQATENLVDINISLLAAIINYLGMNKKILRQSDLRVFSDKSQLLAELVRASGANVYLSGQSGKSYLDQDIMQAHNIRVIYQEFKHPVYKQPHGSFIEGMSIVDLLLNYGKDSVDFIQKGRYE